MSTIYLYDYSLSFRARIVPSGSWTSKQLNVYLVSTTEPTFSVIFAANSQVSCLILARTSFSQGDYDYIIHAEQRNVEIVIDSIQLRETQPICIEPCPPPNICLTQTEALELYRRLKLINHLIE